jgi:hypothetical protein
LIWFCVAHLVVGGTERFPNEATASYSLASPVAHMTIGWGAYRACGFGVERGKYNMAIVSLIFLFASSRAIERFIQSVF